MFGSSLSMISARGMPRTEPKIISVWGDTQPRGHKERCRAIIFLLLLLSSGVCCEIWIKNSCHGTPPSSGRAFHGFVCVITFKSGSTTVWTSTKLLLCPSLLHCSHGIVRCQPWGCGMFEEYNYRGSRKDFLTDCYTGHLNGRVTIDSREQGLLGLCHQNVACDFMFAAFRISAHVISANATEFLDLNKMFSFQVGNSKKRWRKQKLCLWLDEKTPNQRDKGKLAHHGKLIKVGFVELSSGTSHGLPKRRAGWSALPEGVASFDWVLESVIRLVFGRAAESGVENVSHMSSLWTDPPPNCWSLPRDLDVDKGPCFLQNTVRLGLTALFSFLKTFVEFVVPLSADTSGRKYFSTSLREWHRLT